MSETRDEGVEEREAEEMIEQIDNTMCCGVKASRFKVFSPLLFVPYIHVRVPSIS